VPGVFLWETPNLRRALHADPFHNSRKSFVAAKSKQKRYEELACVNVPMTGKVRKRLIFILLSSAGSFVEVNGRVIARSVPVPVKRKNASPISANLCTLK
jgi:hypothetical protein